jgi:hypothetical protein
MRPWYDFEDLCDACGRIVRRHVQTKGDSIYCSTSCRRLEQFLKIRTAKYGITPAVFRKMLADQKGQCAICAEPLGEFGHSENLMHIDHDHVTGAVRSLLCRRCNHGLGFFRENPELLERAANYVRRFKTQ